MSASQRLKAAAGAHVVLAAIPLAATLGFVILLALASSGFVGELVFRQVFALLFFVFAPAAVLNAVVSLFWLIPILCWRPEVKTATIHRRGFLEIYLSKQGGR